MTVRVHLFPFRTQKLSSRVPKILGWRDVYKRQRFKRSCAKSGVLSELRKREHYESPSVKRRKKSEAARAKKKSYR